MKNELNICTSSDNKYAEHMYVMLFSLLYNLKKNYNGIIWILDSYLNNKNKKLLKSLEDKFNNTLINFVHVDENKYKWLRALGWTYQTYFRIDIPNLLPNLNKVLRLDPDIIVNGDVSLLYDLNIDNYAIAATTENKIDFVYEYILKIPNNNWYFNWWVLLSNLNYRRSKWLSDKLKWYLQSQKKNYYHDQDALNAILHDKRKVLPRYYNVTWYQTYKHIFLERKSIIVHYCWWGDFQWIWKPWLPYSKHPLSNLYHKYRTKSNLPDIIPIEKKHIKAFKSTMSIVYNYINIIFPRVLYIINRIFFKIKLH